MGIWDPELREWHGEDDSVEKANLKSLRFSLEIGSCVCLKDNLKRYGKRLATSETPSVLSEFADILEEASRALRTEAEHGAGSLLDLDHPTVKELIDLGIRRSRPVIPQSHISAAERFRSLSHQGR